MSVENLGFSANIKINVLGERELRTLDNAIDSLTKGEELNTRASQSLDKVLAKLGMTYKELAGSVGAGNQANAEALRASIARTSSLRAEEKALKSAAVAARAKAAADRAGMTAGFANAANLTQNTRGDASVAVNSSLFAQRAAAEMKHSEMLRRGQTALMVQEINKQEAHQAAANAQRIATAQATNKALVQIETSARAQETAALRSSIMQRAALEQTRQKNSTLGFTNAVGVPSSGGDGSAAVNTRLFAQQAREIDRVTEAAANQRYALYDVASTWGAVSVATLGAVTAATAAGVSFESSFASVARTSGAAGEAAKQLRTELVDMSTELPKSFADISEIATLGGQLGIAADGLDSFAGTVSKLTATTDLSAEAAGTALGRFQALLGIGSGEFENMASSILKVGVNSAATETQIVNVATQISSMADMAGLTAEQTVGLSGALASVGVQPELARGTVTRAFTLIGNAVSEGGAALDGFARISGMSADQFASTWGTPAFAATFQSFLRGLEKDGDNAGRSLAALGITSVRDVPVMLRLAGAGDVVANSFADAASGWQDNTELTKQYAIVADTTASRLKVLGNTIMAIFGEGATGNLAPLKGLIAMVQNLAEGMLTLARTPVGQWFMGAAAAAGLLVGTLALFRSVSALVTASLLAMTQAQNNMSVAMGRGTGSMKTSITTMAQMLVGTQRATAAQLAYNQALAAGSGRYAAAGAGLKAAASGAAALGGALRFVPQMAALSAIMWAVTRATEAYTESQKTARDRTLEFFGDLGGLTDAMKADGAIFKETGEGVEYLADSNQKFTDVVGQTIAGIQGRTESLSAAMMVEGSMTGTVDETTRAVTDQTLAIGENARAWLAQQISGKEEVKGIWAQYSADLMAAGFNWDTYFAKLQEGGGAEMAYLQSLHDASATRLTDIDNQRDAMGLLTDEQNNNFAAANLQLDGIEALQNSLGGVGGAYEEAANAASLNAAIMGDTAPLEDVEVAAEDAANALRDLMNAQWATVDATIGVNQSLYALGQGLVDNGMAFDTFSQGGMANMQNLGAVMNSLTVAAGGDANALATYLQSLMNSMVASGVTSVQALAQVRNALDALVAGGAKINFNAAKVQTQQMGNVIGGGLSNAYQKAAGAAKKSADKQKKAAKDVKKEIRTLSDYVSDLEGVFKKAFDFEFGLEQAQDEVAKVVQDMADGFDDAAQAVREARQEILELEAAMLGMQAKQGTLEYQLSVATEFGDSLRANEILGELAENNADLQGAQADREDASKSLATAEANNTRVLTGNSAAARDQRAAVLDLVTGYQAQIVELARSGASQQEVARRTAELKAEFERQLTQMGYNRAEVDRYSTAFSNMTTIINNVPRNLTIKADANTSAATKALDEFAAKVNNTTANVNIGTTGGVGYGEGSTAGANYGQGFSDALAASRKLPVAIADPTVPGGKIWAQPKPNGGYYPDRFFNRGGHVNYLATGGPPRHSGGPKGTDTIPAWLTPGEFVQKRSAVEHYGLPFMNALNNMQVPKYLATGGPASGGSGGFPSSMYVELSPTDRALLAAAGNLTVTIGDKVVAEAANRANANSSSLGSN